MPAQAPTLMASAALRLAGLGMRIRAHRKALKVSAAAAASAAGLSRVTLHRIEHGEPSVTMGAYLNVLEALGWGPAIESLGDSAAPALGVRTEPKGMERAQVRVADYPQLRQLAWHLAGSGEALELTGQEALDLYERNWRHIEPDRMTPDEAHLVDDLVKTYGGGRLLV